MLADMSATRMKAYLAHQLEICGAALRCQNTTGKARKLKDVVIANHCKTLHKTLQWCL